mgnify:CR=1 FL=1
MNCEEFRNYLSSGKSIDDKEIEKHLSECLSCNKWIQEEIATPPNGISSDKWNSLKNLNNTQIENTVSKKEEKSFSDYYFSGLKYGVVFGIAIVIGFSIVENLKENEKCNENTPNNLIASDTITLDSTNTKVATDTVTIK